MPRPTAPVRVALTNDFEVVVRGLADMIGDFPDRATVVDLSVDGETVDAPVQVALFDTFGHPNRGLDEISRLARETKVQHIAVYTWDFDPQLVDQAVRAGVSGYLSKALSADELVGALEQIATGRQVISDDPARDRHTDSRRSWPGRDDGLSERESEVLVLIAEGLSNAEIARTISVSPNSVKVHIRHGYRKLGVTTRAQAVRTVMERGMVRRVRTSR